MPNDKVRARCGKWVLPTKKNRHEALCTKCGELKTPIDAVAKAASVIESVPLIEVPEPHDETQQPSAPAPQIDISPPANPADSDPADEEAVVRRVVLQLAPSLNQQTEAVNALLEQMKATKPLTPEEQAAAIDAAVERQINKLVENQRAAQAAQAGGNGQTVAAPGGAPMAGGGGLMELAQTFLPLLMKSQQPTNGLAAIAESLKGLSQLREAMADIFDAPLQKAKLDTLQEVRLLAQLSGSADIDKVADIVGSGIRQASPKAAPTMEPNA